MNGGTPTTEAVLSALEETVARLLERHLVAAREWFPHELVPWERGRNFEPGEVWDETEYQLDPGVRSALFVNLLTEENLPSYFVGLDRLGFRDGPWGEWARRWTAEEARHGAAIRDYVLVTRALDPVLVERERMDLMARGFDVSGFSLIEGVTYAALQELATRVAHLNTGRRLPDPWGQELMTRIAADENRHFVFYRDFVAALLEAFPTATMQAIDGQVRSFSMPGAVLRDFLNQARAIARAGIYDLKVHHDEILQPLVVRHWRVEEVAGLSADGERARDELLRYINRVGRAGDRIDRARRGQDGEARLPSLAAKPTSPS